jgi:hypothetical protein
VKRWVSSLGAVLALWPLLASVAHACPMCFNGTGTNQMAFVYGSLFLMFVPVTAIGTLLYLAYKRTKALEAPPVPRPSPSDASAGEGETRPALHLVRR